MPHRGDRPLRTGIKPIEATVTCAGHTLDSACHTDFEGIAESTGDIIFRNACACWTNLAITNCRFLFSTGSVPTWANTFPNCIAIAFGTGVNSRIFYDGTDSFWDLRAQDTGDLLIALAAGFPSPDPNTVHIWGGTAGAVTAAAVTGVVIENDGDIAIHLLVPATNRGSIFFGDPGSAIQGQFAYLHGSNRFEWFQAGVATLFYSANTFAFQESTTISSTGTLTITAPTINTSLIGTAVGSGACQVAQGSHGHCIPSQATQAAIEAETNEDTYAPPDLIKHSPGVSKAYATVSCAGTLQANSFNVTSSARCSTGNFTVTWNVDFSNTNYTAHLTLEQNNAGTVGWIEIPLVGSVTLAIKNACCTFVNRSFHMVAHGDQ